MQYIWEFLKGAIEIYRCLYVIIIKYLRIFLCGTTDECQAI